MSAQALKILKLCNRHIRNCEIVKEENLPTFVEPLIDESSHVLMPNNIHISSYHVSMLSLSSQRQNNHTTLFKVPHHPLQRTTPPSSKYHITLFKEPHHLLQSTTPPSSRNHTALFKVQQF